MNRLYCEECQFTFENVNAFKSHICSRIANNVSQGNGCYEFSIPGREAEHLNSEERIRELELSKSRILSTTTWTGDDVFRNLNDIFSSPLKTLLQLSRNLTSATNVSTNTFIIPNSNHHPFHWKQIREAIKQPKTADP
ncbi:hypothetical protein TNIN_298301 [Trichonephila inaurata madagascariensis]|uniref:Uncharacterized protein n=1 Tax=Trichonephila inaurata madagascariensis TaxID=2747483 RepID=A0A8X6YDN6_9ARAC|nr:hypothetical protein TNIN_298301 [Trichonephila inaurata madagascariensis]